MLNKKELEQITASIRDAESATSAEIRVCVAKRCKGEPLDVAYAKFKSLKMDTTAQRNSVLIYVATDDHKAAIIGDSGIHEAAETGFWDDVLQEMMSHFKNGLICEGICRGVKSVGRLVKKRYPILEDDINELSDEVILDEE